MEPELEALMQRLDRDDNYHGEILPEMGIGKAGYDFLLTALADGALTERQMCNGISAIFRMRGHGDQERLFELYKRLAECSRQKVRSAAVQMIIGWSRIMDKDGHRTIYAGRRDRVVPFIKRAITMGLDEKVVQNAVEYLHSCLQ